MASELYFEKQVLHLCALVGTFASSPAFCEQKPLETALNCLRPWLLKFALVCSAARLEQLGG
jgi:hypothetical protein